MKKASVSIKGLVISLLVIALTGIFLLIIFQHQAVHSVVNIETEPNNIYDRTLNVAADIDYDPYSFFDENINPSGHNIELIYKLADRMKYNVNVDLLPCSEAVASAENGSADLVLTIAYMPDEYPGLDFSVPLVNDPFVAFGKKPLSQIGELYGKRIAILANTGCASGFIEPYKLQENTIEYTSVSEVFGAVIAGRADYAIVRYSVGRRAMAYRPDTGIKAVGPALLNNYICIGVPKGQPELLDELNNAIISVSSDGTLKQLSEKWLGHYVDTLTFQEYIQSNASTLLYIAAALILVFLICIMFISRSASRKKETLLKKLAERDQLTGLYNRTTCENIIQATLAASNKESDVHALIVIDMDNFKMINDTFGHIEGDAALIRLAGGLGKLFRAGDVIGRLGGDEFFVFMTNCTGTDVSRQKAELIGDLFTNTYSINDSTVHVSCSIGIALYPMHGTSFASLYKCADDALYEAKHRGKNGYAILNEAGEIEYHPHGKDNGSQ